MHPKLFQPTPASTQTPLTRIANPAGITYLKKSTVKSSVYGGSKYHAVDINGRPWERKNDLKKAILKSGGGKSKRQKKPPVVETTGGQLVQNAVQISDNLSTTQPDLITISPELSTNKYKVKKSLVRNRLLAYTNTKNGRAHLYFFTVTFPAGMPEAMGYRCLNTWFTSLRKQNLIRSYLWVAERQKNGTVHFHIAVPHFMKVQHVNGIMRKILYGYAVRKELPFLPEKFAPGKYNGVDIAGHKDIAGRKIPTNFALRKKRGTLAHYLTKYVTKNNELFSHLAWHNSRDFSALFLSIALSKDSFVHTQLHQKLNWAKKFENDHFVFVPWFGEPPKIFLVELEKVNNFFQTLNTTNGN